MNETIEVLRAAKEYLFEHGWHQGNYEDGDGRVCLEGACRRPLGLPTLDCHTSLLDDDDAWDLFFEAGRAIAKTLELPGVVSWNDAPERTFDDVIDAIDLTIKRLEQP